MVFGKALFSFTEKQMSSSTVEEKKKQAEDDLTNADLQYSAAVALMDNNEYEEAWTYILRTLSLAPDTTEAYSDLRLIARVIDNQRQAIEILSKLSNDENADRVAAKYNLALTLQDVGQLERASLQLQSVIELDSEHITAMYTLGLIHYKFKKFNEALDVLANIFDIYPEYAEGKSLAALCYYHLDDFESSIGSAIEATEYDSSNSDAYYALGLCFSSPKYEKRDDLRASVMLSKVIELEPDKTDAYVVQAKLFVQLKEFTKALRIFELLEELDPSVVDQDVYNEVKEQVDAGNCQVLSE